MFGHLRFAMVLPGGIHEFADSQFGHIFAKGPNREAARQGAVSPGHQAQWIPAGRRKSLRFALMNLDVSGDIRHPAGRLSAVMCGFFGAIFVLIA